MRAPERARQLARKLGRESWSDTPQTLMELAEAADRPGIAVLLVAAFDGDETVATAAFIALKREISAFSKAGGHLEVLLQNAHQTLAAKRSEDAEKRSGAPGVASRLEEALSLIAAELAENLSSLTATITTRVSCRCATRPELNSALASFCRLFLRSAGLRALAEEVRAEPEPLPRPDPAPGGAPEATNPERSIPGVVPPHAAEDDDPLPLLPSIRRDELRPFARVFNGKKMNWGVGVILELLPDKAWIGFARAGVRFMSLRHSWLIPAEASPLERYLLRSLPDTFHGNGYRDLSADGEEVLRRTPRWARERFGESPEASAAAYVGRIRRLVAEPVANRRLSLVFDSFVEENSAVSTALVATRVRSILEGSVQGPDPTNAESQQAYSLLEGEKPCVFITGRAGTGKSFLLRYFARHTIKNVVFLAPTGLASMNIGGQTVHSFFRLPPGLFNLDDLRRIRSEERRALYEAIDVIVIDEVSMVSAHLMDAIDRFMRLNGRTPHAPFGGARMIMFGDPFQLPPVVREDSERAFFEHHYRSPFFFDAQVFQDLPFVKIELLKNYRQHDAEFMELLNVVREGNPSEGDLDRLNSRSAADRTEQGIDPVCSLTTTNVLAEEINANHIHALDGPEICFEAEIDGEGFESEKGLPADAVLRLRRGARVLFLRNDPQRRWVNGTFGTVLELDERSVSIRLEAARTGLVVFVEREQWQRLRYQFDPITGRIEAEVIGSFSQLPLRLAWAMTIHKSQGQTLKRVNVDLGSGAFDHGQVYVALSRCPTLEGLTLARPISRKDVSQVDPRVVTFMSDLRIGMQADLSRELNDAACR